MRKGTGGIVLAVCEQLKEKAAAAIAREGFDDVALATFSAHCSKQGMGAADPSSVLQIVEDTGVENQLHVIGGQCLAALQPSVQEHESFRIHRVDQRYQLSCDRQLGTAWLPPSIARVVLEAQLENERGESRKAAAQMNRLSADYAMAYDLMARLTKVVNEAEAIESIMGLFTMLFAPSRLTYLSVVDGKVGQVHALPAAVSDPEEVGDRRVIGQLCNLAQGYEWTASGRGFVLQISHQGEVLGMLQVDEVAFPEYKEHYLNLGLAIAGCCGLAAANARTFEKMREIEAALAAERERLEVTLQSIGDGVIATDIGGRIVLMNRISEHLTGWTQVEASGKPLGEVFHIVNENTREAAENPVEKALTTGRIVGLANDTALIARDGTERSIADSAAPIRDANGGILGVVLVFRDVTDSKQAEMEHGRLLAEVQLRAAELDAANRELEAFSYSVSHDLRAPLRHVDGFGKLLLKACADRLDEQGKEYLTYILQGAERMSQLIDGLLSLSRVARSELRREQVNLSELAQEIAEELRDEQPEHEVSFVILPGVVANGDPRLLRLVLDNLLRNAWKFTSKRGPARIEFGTMKQKDKPVFFVRDNGAGFEMAYVDKLFVPFQRLHGEEEFPGTGIGLATVKRIIHRHGGRVWAEGEVEKGATFYFTLG